MYHRFIKRCMDFLFALIANLILSPLLLIIAIMVRFKLGLPVLLRQERPGLNEKIFTLYKFRTMTEEKDEAGNLLPDSVRMTRFGQWLRSTSLDELPELFNILRGDMSFIGPRPLLVQYLPLYNERQRRRHEVRPGLSGLAQVKGRNAISWEEKFELDIRYVEGVSFMLDLRILILTLITVLRRKGIHSKNSLTMEEFRGNEERKKEKMDIQQLLIIGASGHGRSVADVAMKMKCWQRIAFLDDILKGQSMGIDIIGETTEVGQYIKDWHIFVAIGNNEVRRNLQEKLEHRKAKLATLIHPSAILGEQVEIGAGSVVMAGVVINCCTTVGKGSIVNTGVTLDHDNTVGDYVHVSPGSHLAGTVNVGTMSWLGIGSVVSNNITITNNCIIGAASLVIKDITEAGTYIGSPVRKLSS